MKSVVTFDKSSRDLSCEDKTNIPIFCSKCIKNKEKKCANFYINLLRNNKDGLYKCPYGFGTYLMRNNIYTSFILKNNGYSKVKSSIERNNQKISDFVIYNEDQVRNLINDIEQYTFENITLRDCMHDLRNIGGYFYAMIERIENNHRDLVESDDDAKALISLYKLVNYRLNILNGINSADNKRVKQKLHPLFKKLKIMMSYQAKKKDIKFKIDDVQENYVFLSDNIYLAIFILLENAVKHSAFGSEINVSFKEEKDYTEVCIWNLGQKVEEEEIPRLTERGYRGKNAISKGTGIGLSLAKDIFDAHNCSFKIECIDINHNQSMFKITVQFSTEK